MASGIKDYLISFRSRDFRSLWLITALVNTGSWTLTMAVSWQAYALTHSSAWTGAIMFASLAPNLVGAPVVGVLADALDRRLVIIVAAGLQFAVMAVLGTASFTGLMTAAVLLVLTFLSGFASSALSVTINSLLPSMVARDRLFNAFSLQAVAQRGTEFAGPAVASPILAALGPGAVYLFAACLYGCATCFVYRIKRPGRPQPDGDGSAKAHRGFFGSLLDGFSYLRRAGTIGVLISLVGFHCALTMSYMGVLPQFVQTSLHGSSGFYGVLMSAVGLGSIGGTLFLAGVNRPRTRGMLYWSTALVSGLSLALLALARAPAIAIIAMVLVGSSQAIFMTLSLAYVLERSNEAMRGRVSSVYMVLAGGLMSVANLGYGALSRFVPPGSILLTIGCLFVIIVGFFGLLSQEFRSVSRPDPSAAPAQEGVPV